MNSTPSRAFDIAVIGAGPAGMSAACFSASQGAHTILIDEQPHLGGQIYRSVLTSPLQETPVLDKDYWHGRKLAELLNSRGVHHLAEATVWSIDPSLQIAISVGGEAKFVRPKQVILATGAMERPFAIPGWTLPGVMTVGAAQILLKSSALVANDDVVLAGSGPLLWLLASQYLSAGVSIRAILDTTPHKNYLTAIPFFPAFATSKYFAKGLRLLAKVRREVEVFTNVTELSAHGSDHLTHVQFRQGSKLHKQIGTETLLLHQGVVPNINLANSIGCRMIWDPHQHCWKPEIDGWCQSSVPNIAIAGDGSGIGGAVFAEHHGELSAIGALLRVGMIDESSASKLARTPKQTAEVATKGRKFLDKLYLPPKAHRVPSGETIVCRCEEVTAQQVEDVIALGCPGPNQAKSFLRCGMGPCQGRLCGLTLTEMFSEAIGTSAEKVGYYRLRPPIKPVTLGLLSSYPKTDSDSAAVSRKRSTNNKISEKAQL